MGKIDKLFPWMHESNYKAINMFITESAREHAGICTKEAFECALTYLCINDIKHFYSVTPIHDVVLANLTWWEDGEEQNIIFWGASDIK